MEHISLEAHFKSYNIRQNIYTLLFPDIKPLVCSKESVEGSGK